MGIDPHGEIVDEIIDNDLEENIWNKFINIFKGPVDLKEKGKKNNILHFLVLKKPLFPFIVISATLWIRNLILRKHNICNLTFSRMSSSTTDCKLIYLY